MRDGMTQGLPYIETYEGRMGEGMFVRMVNYVELYPDLIFSRERNRRVLVDLHPCKKYKHFDEEQFFKEMDRLEAR